MVGAALIQRLPAIMRPSQYPRGEVRALRDGGEAADVKLLDGGGAFGAESVEFRRSDRACRTLTEVVVAKGVGDEEDNILHMLLLSGNAANGELLSSPFLCLRAVLLLH